MGLSQSFFGDRFNITERDLERYLAEALSRGGDYADLYFEYLATSNISMAESIVKSATQGVSLGVGVRVLAGERTGYAYSDDLSPEAILKAARVAACLAAPHPRRPRHGGEGSLAGRSAPQSLPCDRRPYGNRLRRARRPGQARR